MRVIKIEYKIKGITLDVRDLVQIDEYYKLATTAEYLLDNYTCIKSEEDAMKIASDVRRIMDKYQLSEEDAIAEIITTEKV